VYRIINGSFHGDNNKKRKSKKAEIMGSNIRDSLSYINVYINYGKRHDGRKRSGETTIFATKNSIGGRK